MNDWKDQLADLQRKQNQGTPKNKGGTMPGKIQFFDSSGVIRPELLDGEARDWALKFIEPPSERSDKRKGLTSAQLRRFFNDAKKLQVRLQAKKDFTQIKPFVKMMKSKAAYACPKQGKKKIPREFKDFIDVMVDSVDNEKDFDAFLYCFEAVVGFFYGEGGRQQ